MVATREAYRRRFAGLLDRELSGDGFVRSGGVFVRSDTSGNAIVLDLQSTVVPGDCAVFFINVGVLLGIEIEVQRRHISNLDWKPTTANGVWQDRLGPEGWDGAHVWRLCSPDDAEREARRASDSLRRQLGWLKSLMDPDVMLAAAKAQRWQRGRVVEGYLLAAQGRVADVEDLLGIAGKDPSELLEFQRYILEVARANARR
jgi:hypothetical protein